MNIKKLVLACAAVSLLYSGDTYAAKGQKKALNFKQSLVKSKANDKKVVSAKPSKNQKRNANRSAKVKTITLLSGMKFSGLEKFPESFLSGGESETFEDVGNEFGTHIQAVWNLNSAEVTDTDEIKSLFNDLQYTTTAMALNGNQPVEDAADAEYDFSELDEMDFQGVMAKYDGSKAFYLNALAKIAYTLQQGTEGHVFWHGMFKIFVSLLVAYHYVPYLKAEKAKAN